MNAYTEFFNEHEIKLRIGRKKVNVSSIDEAKSRYLDYITLNGFSESDLKKRDGELTLGEEVLAVFSFSGRLWSIEEDEIIW